MASGRLWTRDEVVQAILLYCETPFGRIHQNNPAIISLAKRIQRTPGAVGLKLANLANLDTSIDRAGMRNASHLDRAVWGEFFHDPEAFLTQAVSREFYGAPAPTGQFPEGFSEIAGEDITVTKPVRRGQGFFRKAVLASYNSTCCITSINNPELLNASHIIPWTSDKSQRLNPSNGLCLNALHDRAFDRGLLTFDAQMRLMLSDEVRQISPDNFERFEGTKIKLPERFLPSHEALGRHRQEAAKNYSYRF